VQPSHGVLAADIPMNLADALQYREDDESDKQAGEALDDPSICDTVPARRSMHVNVPVANNVCPACSRARCTGPLYRGPPGGAV
jgi:hypothetical protein